jgi:hypothetical protein
MKQTPDPQVFRADQGDEGAVMEMGKGTFGGFKGNDPVPEREDIRNRSGGLFKKTGPRQQDFLEFFRRMSGPVIKPATGPAGEVFPNLAQVDPTRNRVL